MAYVPLQMLLNKLLYRQEKIPCIFLELKKIFCPSGLVKTNGRFFNPNIHVVGEKSPIIVDIVAIC